MPTQNMDDFVMKSKWTILHMWIILLGYTGIDPTLCTESTLWYPSSHEKARKLLSEDWLWMGLSWKSSFWSRKLFLQLHVGNKQCIDAFILPNWNCLNYRPTDTDNHPWRKQEKLSILQARHGSVTVFLVLAFVFPL